MLRNDLTLQKGLAELGKYECAHIVLHRAHPIIIADEAFLQSPSPHPDDGRDPLRDASGQAWHDTEFGSLFELDSDFFYNVRELVWNALEHGSQWCRMGPVTLDFYRSTTQRTVLLAVEDPGAGFAFEEYITQEPRRAMRNGVLRGGGLSGMHVQGPQYAYGFERIEHETRKGFRSLLLYTPLPILDEASPSSPLTASSR